MPIQDSTTGRVILEKIVREKFANGGLYNPDSTFSKLIAFIITYGRTILLEQKSVSSVSSLICFLNMYKISIWSITKMHNASVSV